MIKKEQLKHGMIIRFKQNADKVGGVNKSWLLKKLKFIGFDKWFGEPSIAYTFEEHINKIFTNNKKIHTDIPLIKLQYMEIVSERKSHLPKW